MSPLQRAPIFLAPVIFSALVQLNAHAAPTSVPMTVLKKCAEIHDPLKRLGCYDQVAERPADSTAAAIPPAQPAITSTNASATARPATPPKESFGLYSSEHPAAPAVQAAITAKVVSIGSNRSGHTTVTLEGDQVWVLDNGDPVLVAGDSVTVKRGALGSFILLTPSGRLHRVHRAR